MQRKIGIGVIGCGARMRNLLSLLPGLGKDYAVMALCDPSPKSIESACQQFNPHARVFANYRDLVADPTIEWVAIGSWNCQHQEHAIAALTAGKHVFCEKPLATTLEDCVAMRRAWLASGNLFYIGFTLRYSPHYCTIRRILDTGTIGSVISFEFNETLEFNHGGFIHSDWRRLEANAGSHLLEKCCHDIDLANWMIGSLPARVASFGGLNFFRPQNARHMKRLQPSEGRLPYRAWPTVTGLDPFHADKDIVDNQVVILEYANGVRATFHTNCNAAIPERRMLLLGTEGAIRADVIEGRIELRRIGFNEPLETVDAGVKGGHGGGDPVLTRQWDAGLRMGAPPAATLEDGLRSAVTCFGIDEAQRSGRVIEMAPLWRAAGVAFASPGHEPEAPANSQIPFVESFML